jgi:hypothetical protein
MLAKLIAALFVLLFSLGFGAGFPRATAPSTCQTSSWQSPITVTPTSGNSNLATAYGWTKQTCSSPDDSYIGWYAFVYKGLASGPPCCRFWLWEEKLVAHWTSDVTINKIVWYQNPGDDQMDTFPPYSMSINYNQANLVTNQHVHFAAQDNIYLLGISWGKVTCQIDGYVTANPTSSCK